MTMKAVEEKHNLAKEFLEQVPVINTHINNKLEELEHLKSLALKITSSMKADVVSGGGGNHDKVGDAVAKIVDLEREINESIDTFVDKKKEVSAVIEMIDDPKQIEVLYKRYFHCKNWEQIACEMGYTYRNVCIIHGRALQTISELLKEG